MTVIGVRAHDYGKQTPGNLIEAIASDGWQTIQLAFPKAIEGVNDFSDVSQELTEKTAGILAANNLGVAVLGVYIEPSLTEEQARSMQVNTLISALPQAVLLKAACVGTETTSMAKQPGVTHGEALKQLRRSLEEILPEAERLGVTLALEPVHYHTLNTPELVRSILDDMRSVCLKVIFDPVNLLRTEDIDSQNALWSRCLHCFEKDIVAVHIKGASRTDKDVVLLNAPLEQSVVNYKYLFEALRGLNAPLLRELAVPARAKDDIKFLSSLL